MRAYSSHRTSKHFQWHQLSNRKSIVGQADIARVIRACRQAGQPVVRIVIRSDRVEVETGSNSSELEPILAAEDGGIIL